MTIEQLKHGLNKVVSLQSYSECALLCRDLLETEPFPKKWTEKTEKKQSE